jgi:hypothetical protein
MALLAEKLASQPIMLINVMPSSVRTKAILKSDRVMNLAWSARYSVSKRSVLIVGLLGVG